MIDKFKTEFLDVLTNDTYPQYKSNGKRSTRKLIGIHSYLGQFIESYFSSIPNIRVMWNEGDDKNKEASVPGAYYPKKIDITVLHESKPVLCIGFKFPCSNYKQNNINYYENMLGETCNIQQAKIPYFHILVLPAEMPYCNKDGEITRSDKITEHDIEKYIKLCNDSIVSSPYCMLILLIDFDSTYDNIIGYSDPKVVFQSKKIEYQNFAETFMQTFTVDKFFDKLDEIKSKLQEAQNG